MLISIIQRYFVYIGNTNDINKILRDPNSGIGFQTSQPVHLQPYSLFAYICCFNGNQSLMYYIEHKYKYNVRRLESQGMNNTCIWLQRGRNELFSVDLSNYGISKTMFGLRLIRLFKDRKIKYIFAISLGSKVLCTAYLALLFINH